MDCKECLSAQPRASHGVMTDAGLALRARLAKIQVTISSQIPTRSWVTVLLGLESALNLSHFATVYAACPVRLVDEVVTREGVGCGDRRQHCERRCHHGGGRLLDR